MHHLQCASRPYPRSQCIQYTDQNRNLTIQCTCQHNCNNPKAARIISMFTTNAPHFFFSVQSSESSLDGWQQEQTTPLSNTKSKHYVLSRIVISILKFVFYNTLTCTQHTNQGPTPWSSLDQHHRHRKHLSRTLVSHLGRCHTLAGGLATPHSDSTSSTNI